MLIFGTGFFIGYVFHKLQAPLLALWKRTEKKLEKEINGINKQP